MALGGEIGIGVLHGGHWTMVKRTAIVVHRWLGVALSVLFFLWFASGIGMMYWPFPAVTPEDRLERAPALDPSRITLSVADAAALVDIDPSDGQVRLHMFDGRPVYRFADRQGWQVVYADTGEEHVEASRAMRDRLASAWTGQPAHDARVDDVEDVDQWTVQAPLRTMRPLWKYSWPNGEQLYITEAGDIVQYTTTASRVGAYLGPIPHWFYFTPLRARQQLWSGVVIWASGMGTVAVILGLVAGVWTYSPSRRYRDEGQPASLPYRGFKRWHALIGLIVGVAAITWTFSGLLSMDPFPMAAGNVAATARDIGGRLRGETEIAAFAAKHPREALEQLTGRQVKELELASFAGEAVYLATLAGGETRIVPTAGEIREEFDRGRIIEIVKDAGPAGAAVETRIIDQYDRYYLDRDRRAPLPVVLALMHDREGTRLYIDPKTARIVGGYGGSQWVTRWIYHGLHSLNFPWLYNHRPLWDIVVIGFMFGGTALCVTSLVLAWQVLGRTIARPGR
jgi:hypothetical protein